MEGNSRRQLKTLKMKMKHSTNVRIISGVVIYAKLGGKLE
jgi:hypothetical protein